MTELIVMRHGETDWNRQHRFQGQIDVPLNAAGRAQAERLAQRLAHEAFDVVVASDLQRARTTAEVAAAGRDIASEPLWREQSFGVLEGLDAPTIIEQHPQLWRHGCAMTPTTRCRAAARACACSTRACSVRCSAW